VYKYIYRMKSPRFETVACFSAKKSAPASPTKHLHRITEWYGLEGTSSDNLV